MLQFCDPGEIFRGDLKLPCRRQHLPRGGGQAVSERCEKGIAAPESQRCVALRPRGATAGDLSAQNAHQGIGHRPDEVARGVADSPFC